MKRKVALSLAVGIMASALLGSTAMAQVFTDPVGFVKADVYQDGLTMISIPLEAADNALNGAQGCVGDMLAEGLDGGVGAASADVIWRWDAASQGYQTAFLIDGWGPPYDGRWYDEAAGAESTMTFAAGDACWIQRRSLGNPVETVTFLGWVPMGETTTVTMVKGLSMFNWPYPTTLAINDSTLGGAGTGGIGAADADVVWEWLGASQTYKTAFLIDGWGAPWDGQWYDEAAGAASDIDFGPGKAFWYQRRPDNSAVWICSRPY